MKIARAALAALASAALGLAALAGPASADEPQSVHFEGIYAVSARVGTVGEFEYKFDQSAAGYQASAERRLTGFVRMLAGDSQDYTYNVQGAVADGGALRPNAYSHRGGRRDRLVQARFTADDIVTTANPHMGMGHPAATQAQKRGAIDQLSAIASMIVADGEVCARTVPVYMDGRSRFDFVMTPNGTVNVSTPGYRGPASRCNVQFRPIAGFSDPQEPAELTFLFARTPSGLNVPIRIQMPTDDVGIVTLEARSLTLNGDPLQ